MANFVFNKPKTQNKIFKSFKSPFGESNGFKLPPAENRIGLSPLTLPMEGLPRVIYYTADGGGCAFYRMLWPMEYLISTNKAVCMNMYQMVLHPMFYEGLDAVVLQRQCGDHQVAFVKELKKFQQMLFQKNGKAFKMIFEIDDIVIRDLIPDYNRCKEAFDNDKIGNNIKEIMPLMDEFTVVSKTMKKHYKDFLGNYDKITVIPDYIPPTVYDRWYNEETLLKNFEDNKDRPRILYAGSATHFDIANRNGQKDDFSDLLDFIIKNHKKYKFVFLGGFPLKLQSLILSKEIEYHPWVDLFDLPKKMLELKCQVCIAPLANNAFNASKANIKLTEAGALGIPVIAQNLACYEEGFLNFDTISEFEIQLNNVLDSRFYLNHVRRSRAYAEEYFLDKHLDEHMLVLTTPYGDPKRLENKWFVKNNS